MRTPTIPFDDFQAYWNYDTANLDPGLPRCTPNSKCDFLNTNDRLFEVLGSLTNRSPFRLLDGELNRLKGKIFEIGPNGRRTNPVAPQVFEQAIEDSIRDEGNEEAWLEPLRGVS